MAIEKRFASEEYVDEKIVQPDWNQNDESQLAFIKNRPFYTGDPVETFIVEETTFELVDGMGQLTSTHPLEVGQEYTVTLDGATYNCVAKLNEEFSLPYIGNAVLVGGGEDTGESFFIAPTDLNFGIMINSDIAEHTVSIICMISEIHQIDEKYIPDTVKVGKKVEGQVFTITNDDETPTEVTAGVGAEIFNNYKEDSGISTYILARVQDINIATGDYSHAEGYGTTASGNYSHAEGYGTTAYGDCSHAEGERSTASGRHSHAEGWSTASGDSSHAEGSWTIASGYNSHAEGYETTASGDNSHSQGSSTTASGWYSHAEGYGTTASGNDAHAEGLRTIAAGEEQHVQGKYNVIDSENKYAHIVGNGSSNSKRSNAHTLDWSGNAEFQGDVKANACGGEKPISLVETATIAKVLYGNITTPMEDYFSSGNPFVSADITFNDIKTAYDAGRDVKLKWESYIYSLGYESDTQFGFSCNGIAIDNIINVFSSGDIAVSNEFVK